MKNSRLSFSPLIRFFYRILIIVVPLTLIVGVVWLVDLDLTIQRKFEGKRWELPARVYARPLELYAGRFISIANVEQELLQLGYQRVKQLKRAGSFRRVGQKLELYVRGFYFPDGQEKARRVTVEFLAQKVLRVNASQGASELVRLDPLAIGTLYPVQQQDRQLVKLEQVPLVLIQALLATEDRHFMQHRGVDPQAIARALLANISSGSVVQGGSTITQQLVKNFFLSSKRSYLRKINEAVMALLLEWHYDKPEILETYLNEVYLGQAGKRAIHGVGLASHYYFGRPLAELDVAELALLVGIIKGPSYYNPWRHPKRAIARRNLVLNALLRGNFLDQPSVDRAKKMALTMVDKPETRTSKYPVFMELVKRRLLQHYRAEDLRIEGLDIFTTLDPLIQQQGEKQMAGRIWRLEKDRGLPFGQLQGAAVVTQVGSGEVVALFAGRRQHAGGFNRALDARRPIGSLIKPVIYMEALRHPQKYSLVTPLDDAEISLKDYQGKLWQPHNFDKKSHGQPLLEDALSRSYNQATVRLGLDLGVRKVADLLQRMGVKKKVTPFPSLLLGAVELSPLEITEVYQTLANGGYHTPLRAIRGVMTKEHRLLQQYPMEITQVVDASSAYLTQYAMQRVVSSGTARSLQRLWPNQLQLAGKTGTSDDYRDSWFVGFSGSYLATVWLGRDDNQPIGMTGSRGALPVWVSVMRQVAHSPLQLKVPENIDWLSVPSEATIETDDPCRLTREVPFIQGELPPHTVSCDSAQGHTSSFQQLLRRLVP